MASGGVVDKGLKKDALGFVSSVVIGVASTAPGYSLAAVLTLVVAAVGLQSPAILILAFLPMLFIAASYYYMNRADPDCGTTFSWVTRAMGPWAGWIGGWAIIVADIIVMANLAQIAGLYGFLLFDWQAAAESTFAVTASVDGASTPNSRNEYRPAIWARLAITIRSATMIAQPPIQPVRGPKARVAHANVVPASGSAWLRYL